MPTVGGCASDREDTVSSPRADLHVRPSQPAIAAWLAIFAVVTAWSYVAAHDRLTT